MLLGLIRIFNASQVNLYVIHYICYLAAKRSVSFGMSSETIVLYINNPRDENNSTVTRPVIHDGPSL
jgi:hypothetical protein